MFQIRKSDDRGRGEHGWLSARHTFSFAGYHDPAHVRFRKLRVMNEDRVAPGQGFGTHPHDNMEIITYVMSGALEHLDSMGNGSVIPAGSFQRMSAGSGVTHSEFNPSDSESTHLYQVWVFPSERDIEPTYEEWSLGETTFDGLRLVAAPGGGPDAEAMKIVADASLYLGRPAAGAELRHAIAPGRHAWVQVTRGEVGLGEQTLVAGDGVAVSDEPELTLRATSDAELLLFDLG
ncbi:Quercetin 2,3-dioxygenase [Pseudobythopirellula maris]|uniref:Quercetin 2,3-dioxygenase n=1 Tax=Pseudobythopirellula maris TaxID=2527991 RepID=A0A5C5ZLU4_9BACT|nr:pirin family protein [Pseudobythopirellula maris]TWT87413.1 Quercetin 2,3-dioxygenase [Pseudobythopirellula maris]